MKFRFWLILIVPFLLSACYSHSRSYMAGPGTLDLLPKKFVLAGDDDKTGMILSRAGSYYKIEGGAGGEVRVRRLQGDRTMFLAEMKTIKDGKTSYITVPFQQKGAKRFEQILDVEAVTSARDIDQHVRAALKATKPKGRNGFTIYDLSNSRDLADARKWFAAVEAKKKKKGSTSNTSKPAKNKTKPVPRAGQFVFTEEKDVMTGKTKQFVFGFTNAANIGKPPYIRFGCYGRRDKNPLGLTVEWGQPLYDSFDGQAAQPVARITTKFGSAQPMELGWSMSGSRTQTYAPSVGVQLGGNLTKGILGAIVPNATKSKMDFNWNNRNIHQAFWRHPSVALRGYGRSGQEITMVFDAKDFRKVAANFNAHCRL